MSDKPTYRAFLSYSHSDTAIARKVHARLENFRIDKDLAGRESAQGPVPASLRPIFRDRSDFSAGRSLDEQTLSALDASAALIVLASPHAAASRYVDEEIRLFKSRHPDRPIVPLIVKGARDAGEVDYFPPALRFVVVDGVVSEAPDHVLAADLREESDGFLLAIAKVVARLIDVSPDVVFRRAERERRRHVRFQMSIAALVGVLAVVGGLLFWQSHEQKRTLAEIDALVRRYSATGPAAAGRAQSLTQAFTSIAEGAATDPRYAKALELLKLGHAAAAEPLLKAVAEDKARRAEKDARDAAAAYRNLATIAAVSDPARARDYFARAVRLDPSNVEGLLQSAAFQSAAGNLDAAETSYGRVLEMAKPGRDDFTVFYARLGLSDLERTRGHLDKAIKGFRDTQALAEQHVARTPSEMEWQFSAAISMGALADSLIAQGKLSEALALYRSDGAILERVAKSDTVLPARQVLAASRLNTGRVLFAQGDLVAALESYHAGRAILIDLSKAQPESLVLRRELSIADINIADALMARGKLQEAQASIEAAVAAADHIAKADPNNERWQRDLAIVKLKIGNVQVARGDLAGALTTYLGSREIVAKQLRRDPENVVWRRQYSAVTSRVANVKAAQGDAAGALDAYSEANAANETLSAADPGNADLRSDLAISQRDVGTTLLALGRVADAVTAYRRSLAIAEALAKSAEGNANWQRDLEVARNRLGNALIAAGDLPGALQAFRHGEKIAETLVALDATNSDWQRDLSIAKNNIGSALGAQGNAKEALAAYLAALPISLSLARADPQNAGWQSDLAATHRRVGEMQSALNHLSDAEASFRASLVIDERRVAAAPDNVDALRDLAVSHVKVGGIQATQRKLDAALQSFEAARTIIARLAGKSDAFRHDLSGVLGRIGDVQVARNEPAAALEAFKQELDISEQLAAKAPDNTSWQYQLALAYGHLATLYDRTKRDADALDALHKGREVLVRLTASHPGWADWRDDLAWFDKRIAAAKK